LGKGVNDSGKVDNGLGNDDNGLGKDGKDLGINDKDEDKEDKALGKEENGLGINDKDDDKEGKALGKDDNGLGKEDNGLSKKYNELDKDDNGLGKDDKALGKDDNGLGIDDKGGTKEDNGLGKGENEDDASESSQAEWAGVDLSNFDEDDVDYLLRVPRMPDEGDAIHDLIPHDAINILQRFCYSCRPSDHIRLMINIVEAIVGTLQQPCRPFFEHKGRAWEVGLGVDLAMKHGPNLASLEALETTWKVLHSLLTALGKAAERFRNEGGRPSEMMQYCQKLQKCQICIHLSKKWIEDGESGEDPDALDILDTLQRRAIHGLAAILCNADLQATLQARLQASMRR